MARTIRQDVSFVVSVLLLLAVVLAALTAWAVTRPSSSAWATIYTDWWAGAWSCSPSCTPFSTGGQMVNYAKRRMRNRFGVGGVICSSSERPRARHKLGGFDETR